MNNIIEIQGSTKTKKALLRRFSRLKLIILIYDSQKEFSLKLVKCNKLFSKKVYKKANKNLDTKIFLIKQNITEEQNPKNTFLYSISKF